MTGFLGKVQTTVIDWRTTQTASQPLEMHGVIFALSVESS
jgi:hypothetical protein